MSMELDGSTNFSSNRLKHHFWTSNKFEGVHLMGNELEQPIFLDSKEWTSNFEHSSTYHYNLRIFYDV